MINKTNGTVAAVRTSKYRLWLFITQSHIRNLFFSLFYKFFSLFLIAPSSFGSSSPWFHSLQHTQSHCVIWYQLNQEEQMNRIFGIAHSIKHYTRVTSTWWFVRRISNSCSRADISFEQSAVHRHQRQPRGEQSVAARDNRTHLLKGGRMLT